LQPLRITAVLETGQVATTDGRLPLDSIIAAAWMRRHRPDLYYNNPAGRCGGAILFHPTLPLERRETDGEWYWACSFAQYELHGEHIAYWHKRFNVDEATRRVDFDGRRGRVPTSSGYYKEYRMPIVYLVTPELTWYAVGNGDKLRSLLDTIIGVGKKTGMGYGMVAEWRVEPWPEDLSCHDSAGKPMRAIPQTDGPHIAGIRPPYWHPENAARCILPTAEALHGRTSQED